MVALNRQEKQVVELFFRLDPQRRRLVLLEMAKSGTDSWKRFQVEGEARLREIAKTKGLNWDQLDDERRQQFIEQELDGEQP